MRKIEKLDEKTIKRKAHSDYNSCNFEVVFDKINELVDAFNKLSDHTHSVGPEVSSEPEIYSDENAKPTPRQTQEPERKHCKKHGLYDCVYGCEKEPECEHEWEYWRNYAMKRCKKCNEQMPLGKFEEKPAKKECEHKGFVIGCADCEYEIMKHPKKDELAERLEKKADGMPNFHGYCSDRVLWNFLADEARKWAVEQVLNFNIGMEYLSRKELVARLKESK